MAARSKTACGVVSSPALPGSGPLGSPSSLSAGWPLSLSSRLRVLVSPRTDASQGDREGLLREIFASSSSRVHNFASAGEGCSVRSDGGDEGQMWAVLY